MKFCVDCIHYSAGSCHHSNNLRVSIVTGKVGPYKSPEWLRTLEMEHECGESGKWFEPRTSCLSPMSPDQYFDGRGRLREQRNVEGHH